MTTLEATRKWVQEFDRIPIGIVHKLLDNNIDELLEITPITVGDTVETYDHGECEVRYARNGMYTVMNSDGELIDLGEFDVSVLRDDILPMWGTMWAFSDITDNEWLETHLQEMADCGFRIYEQEDYGYIFGIDGAGYDFYESHWIPLYKTRGLKWDK